MKLSDKRLNSLIKKIDKVYKNYTRNTIYIRKQLSKMKDKSSHFERTPIYEDLDIVSIKREILLTNPNKLKNNSNFQERARSFITKYGKIGKFTSSKRAFNSFILNSRDEYLSHFIGLGFDKGVVRFLNKNELFENPNFWKEFFNSNYFTPLYTKYDVTNKDTYLTISNFKGKRAPYGTWWGKRIKKFAKEYLKKNTN